MLFKLSISLCLPITSQPQSQAEGRKNFKKDRGIILANLIAIMIFAERSPAIVW